MFMLGSFYFFNKNNHCYCIFVSVSIIFDRLGFYETHPNFG